MAQNISMPMFGRAGNANESSWNEVDNFDVDLLAEYLLDDGSLHTGGVTFDFNMQSDHGSSMVSPENSEDGNLPPVADTKNYFAAAPTPMAPPQQMVPTMQMSTAPSYMPVAPMISPQQQQQQHAATMMHHHHQQQHEDPAAKRRRIDAAAPMMTTAGNAAPMISSQQLAAAAASMQGRGRKKSQAQIDRRRERNRILARRTRLRKKFFFESLQKEVLDLQKENSRLKQIVKMEIDNDEGHKILEECDAMEKLPPGVMEACAEENDLDSQDFNLVQSIRKSQHAFVITDPSLHDNPIVFASDDFLKMTGYTREQVLGRNCRFLQGTETSQDKIGQVRKGLQNGEDVTVTMINYTANGQPFWNKLFIAALRDAQDSIVNFIGVTVKVASPEPGDPEFGKALSTEQADDESDNEDDIEDTVKAMEGAVTAAVAAASGP